MTRYHAVVIGGGPAGAFSALLLARLGWRTALVERGPRHRAKACGDCLNPRATRELDRAGLLAGTLRNAVGVTRRLRVHVPERSPLCVPMPTGGLLVERRRFDQFLIDRAADAGADVFQPASGRLEALGERQATVRLSRGRRTILLRTRLVVAADGLRSSVAAAAGLARAGPRGRKFGFALDLRPPRPDVVRPDTIEMFVGPGGYLGVVNQGGGVMHVAGLVSGSRGGPRHPLEFIESIAGRFDVLRETGIERVLASARRTVLGAGPMPDRPRRVAGARVALVGDAAGYAEPFTGEGMAWALHSAAALAGSVAGVSPGSWSTRTARGYLRHWAATVGCRQRVCRGLAWALERPGLVAVAPRHRAVACWLARRVAS